MNSLFKEIRHNPLLWLLAFVPVVFVAEHLRPDSHTLQFFLSVLAIVPYFLIRGRVTRLARGLYPDQATSVSHSPASNNANWRDVPCQKNKAYS